LKKTRNVILKNGANPRLRPPSKVEEGEAALEASSARIDFRRLDAVLARRAKNVELMSLILKRLLDM
jgi:hypothetical protein